MHIFILGTKLETSFENIKKSKKRETFCSFDQRTKVLIVLCTALKNGFNGQYFEPWNVSIYGKLSIFSKIHSHREEEDLRRFTGKYQKDEDRQRTEEKMA